jgi:hypothetical protein
MNHSAEHHPFGAPSQPQIRVPHPSILSIEGWDRTDLNPPCRLPLSLLCPGTAGAPPRRGRMIIATGETRGKVCPECLAVL